jgi:hypothetical protein
VPTPTVSPSHTPSPTPVVADPGGDGCSMAGTRSARNSAVWLAAALLWVAWRRSDAQGSTLTAPRGISRPRS